MATTTTIKPSSIKTGYSHLIHLFLFVFILSFNCVTSETWAYKPSEIPNPQHDPKGICGRQGLKSAVCDPDGYLSQPEADTIDGLIKMIHSRTQGFENVPGCSYSQSNTTSGPEVSVLILSKKVNELTGFEFAKEIQSQWGVGNKQCQNGVVLLVSVLDHEIAVSIGSGLTSIFTDNLLPSFFKSVGQIMKQKKYGEAMIYGVTLIGDILSLKNLDLIDIENKRNGSSDFVITVGVVTLVLCGFLFCLLAILLIDHQNKLQRLYGTHTIHNPRANMNSLSQSLLPRQPKKHFNADPNNYFPSEHRSYQSINLNGCNDDRASEKSSCDNCQSHNLSSISSSTSSSTNSNGRASGGQESSSSCGENLTNAGD